MAEEGVEVKQVGPSSPPSPQTSVQKPPSPRCPRQCRRIKITDQQLETTTKEELTAKWREQDLYIEFLEAQSAAQEGTDQRLERGVIIILTSFLKKQ